MSVALSIKPEGFTEAAKALSEIPARFPKNATEAINKGLEVGQKTASQLIKGRYSMGGAKGSMAIKKGSWMAIGGTLEIKGPMHPASMFSPSKGRGGISVAIIKGGRKIIKGAFMIRGKVFARRSSGEIGPVSTIGIPFMVGYMPIATQVQEEIAKVAMEFLGENMLPSKG